MTKQQAKDQFIKGQDFFVLLAYSGDKPRIRQMWNDFVDGLQKSGQITEAQANRWVNPLVKKADR